MLKTAKKIKRLDPANPAGYDLAIRPAFHNVHLILPGTFEIAGHAYYFPFFELLAMAGFMRKCSLGSITRDSNPCQRGAEFGGPDRGSLFFDWKRSSLICELADCVWHGWKDGLK